MVGRFARSVVAPAVGRVTGLHGHAADAGAGLASRGPVRAGQRLLSLADGDRTVDVVAAEDGEFFAAVAEGDEVAVGSRLGTIEVSSSALSVRQRAALQRAQAVAPGMDGRFWGTRTALQSTLLSVFFASLILIPLAVFLLGVDLLGAFVMMAVLAGGILAVSLPLGLATDAGRGIKGAVDAQRTLRSRRKDRRAGTLSVAAPEDDGGALSPTEGRDE